MISCHVLWTFRRTCHDILIPIRASESWIATTTSTTRRSNRKRFYHEVSFQSVGSPLEVLSYLQLDRSGSHRQDEDRRRLGNSTAHDDSSPDDAGEETMVRIEMNHVPWNPADMNTVQGRYPSSYDSLDREPVNGSGRLIDPSIPYRPSRYWPERTVAGSEGWGIVTDVVHTPASSASAASEQGATLQPGDWVTMGHPGLGTMRSSLWLPSRWVLPLSDRGPRLFQQQGPASSTLLQLGGTAWRMLHDFVDLAATAAAPQEVVVLQNAGNSAVGLVLSQLAATLGYQVASLVRRNDRSPQQYQEMVEYLMTVGRNSLVVAEEDVQGGSEKGGGGGLSHLQHQLQQLSPRPPSLAVNAVGGASAMLLLKLLRPGGTMVTYGGMSGKPVTVGTAQLIFQDLRVVGYWQSRWMIQASFEQRQRLLQDLLDLALKGQVQCPPVQVFPLSEVKAALEFQQAQSLQPIRSKVVFDCQE